MASLYHLSNYKFGVCKLLRALSIRLLWSQQQNGKTVWEATAIGHCFLLQEQLLSIGELQVHWKYVINHVRNSGNICSHKKKTEVITLHGESQFDSAGAIGLYLTKSSEMIVSTASWKNIMESCCDQRIRDHNNLMERCPHYLLISLLGLHSHTCKVFRLLQGLSNVLNPHPGIPIAFIVFFPFWVGLQCDGLQASGSC
jgi:hypothetical protein